MKKISKIAACGLLASLGASLMVSCGEETANTLAQEVLSKVILTQDGTKVQADFTIPKSVKFNDNTYEISWTSSDSSVINPIENNETSFLADVKRPFAANVDVLLTASVTAEGKKADANFKIEVVAIDAKTALEQAINNAGIKASYGAKEEVTLPEKSNEYKEEIRLEYSLGGTYASTKLEGNKLTLDPTLAQETVVVKVKATAGTNVIEKDLNVKLSLKPVYLTASEALAVAKGEKLYFQGEIESVDGTNGAKYGNFWIKDETGKKILIYGLYKGLISEGYAEGKTPKTSTDCVSYDKWAENEKLAVGDYIYAYGVRDAYQTKEEVVNCLIMGVVKGAPASTVTEALAEEDNKFVTIVAKIDRITSTTYGNMYLKDEAGKEILLYGLYEGKASACYDAAGAWLTTGNPSVRFDKMTTKPAVGDVIMVYGPMTTYKTERQVKNALLQVVVKSSGQPAPDPAPVVLVEKTVEGTELVLGSLGFADKDLVGKINFTGGSITFVKGASDTAVQPTYYNGGTALRVYGGATITIKADKAITSIKFEYVPATATTSYAIADGMVTLSSGEMDYTADSWTGNSNEVVITNTSTKQFRIVKITITLAE